MPQDAHIGFVLWWQPEKSIPRVETFGKTFVFLILNETWRRFYIVIIMNL